MQVSVVRIGNSRGIRLNKTLLDHYQITDRVELIPQEGYLVIKPVDEPRTGWAEAFQRMSTAGDDELLLPDFFDDESLDEW
jgi:antitoxin MazE